MIKYQPILLIILVLLLYGCGSPQQNTSSMQRSNDSLLSGKLIITGSSTIAPLAAELASRFETQHKNVKVDVQTGGSSRGIADVRQNLSNIGMVSRSLKTGENDITSHLLAKDGVSIIVHKSNPLKELSSDQIKAIYRGEINNWKSINGKNKKITVINKAEGRSTLEVFLKHFALKNTQIKPDIIIGDNEQGIKLVSNNPDSIAYVSIGTAEYDINLGIPIKTLALDGVEANTETLLKNQFPLSRELNFVTSGDLSILAKTFIEFSLSNQTNTIIKDYGFVPIQPR